MAANPFSDPEFGADAAKGAKPASKKNPFSDPEFGKEPKRTWGEAAKDTGAAVMGGLAGLVKTGGDLYGLASGNMDNAASELGRNAQEYWSDAKSQALQTKIAQRKANIDAQESTLGKAWTAVKDTLTDPALAADTVAENVATMLPGAGVGRAVGAAKYARGFQAASEFGPASLAAREAIAKQAGKYATGAAIGTGAVQQGADVSGDIYGDLMKKTDAEWDASPDFQAALQRHGGDRQAAKSELANATARAAFLPTAGISVAANAIPGATYLERALVGAPLRTGAKEVGRFGAARGFARGVLGEGGQEFVEEGGGRLGANLAAQQQAMPGHDTWDGVGENAGMGFAGGALLGVGGGVHGAREAMAQKRAQDAAKGAEDGGTLGTPAADTPPADVPPGDGQAGPGGGLGAPTGAGADMAGMLAPANPLLEAMNQRAADPSAIAPPIDDGKIFDKSAAAPVAGELYQPGDTTNPLTGERITAKPSEAMGLNPATGPLSAGAAVAVDTGVAGGLQQAAAQAQADQQAQASQRTDFPMLEYAGLSDDDRAAYDSYFNSVSEQTDDHLAAAISDGDIPDFGDESNVSEVEFLRRMGASEQEILDAIEAASTAGGPQAGARGAAETQTDVADSARPFAGADSQPGTGQESAQALTAAERAALQADLDAEQEGSVPGARGADRAFASVTEDAGALPAEPTKVSTTTKGTTDGTQAQETQQAGQGQQEARAGQAGARDESHLNALELRLSHERGRLRAAQTDAERTARQVTVDGIEREIAGERKFLGLAPQAASAMSDDALMQALKPDGAEKTSTAQPPLSGTISPQPQAAGPAIAAPEFTTIKTVHGDSVTVRTSDLQGDAPRLRQYTKAGKAKAVPAIHRDNLDLTGEKSAERAKENAKNPLFHTVTTKDGGAFASQAAAQREVNRLGLQDSHEVVEAGGGFVGRIKKTGEQHSATARNLRLADERTPGAGAAAPHGPGESVAGEAPVVGAGQRQQAQAAAGNAAKPANLFSDPRTGAPVVVQNKATADAMARSKQLSGKVAVRKATPAEMADERNAFTGYNAGENRRIGYVLEMLPPKDAPATHAVTDRDNAQDKADAFIKTLTSKDGDASAPVAEPPAPAGRTYLAVPFNEKDYAKRAGAKWDEGKKLWYADPVGGDGAAAGEININLKQYVPQDSTKDDRYNYYGDKALATAVALNASARDGVQYDTIKRKHPDGIMMWSVVKAGEQTQAESAEKTSAATENVAQTITAADVQADTPKLTQAEAKALMEWQDLGQKNGVKTHILTFYESKADKDAKRGRMIVAKVTKGDRSASNWMVDGDDKPLAVLGMAKKRAEDAGMARLVADGYVGEAPTTGPKPARITPDIAANMKAGDVVVDEDGKEYRANAARHGWLEAHPIVDGKAQVNADSRVMFHLDPQTASAYPERSHKAVFLKEEAAEANPLADYNALAKQYGYEVRPDGAIGSDGKFPGPKMKVKGGRLRIESGSGDLLASYAGTSPDGLGKFLESFWYAEKKAAGGPAPAEDAPMFSRAQAKEIRNLVTLHNLTDENLRFADSMGGIPVPSIGITKVDSPFSGFGGITLIAPKGMVDPESGVPVFDRDAWTARFPEMNFKKPKRAKADAFYERMKAMTNGLGVDEGNFLSNLWESMVNASVTNPDKVADHLRRYDAARMAYARDVLGKNIKVPMRSVPLSSPAANDKQLQAYWKKNGQRLIELEYELSGSNFSNTPEYKSFVREVEGAVRRYAEASGKPERADAYVSMFLPDGELGPGGFDRLGRDFAAVGKKEVDGLKLREAVRKVVPDNDPAYLQWVSDQVKPLFDAPTITLRGKEVEPTLDNIVDAMTVGATAGVEKSMTFSAGKAAAMLGKRFKSMDEIKAARDQVVSPQAEAEGKKSSDALLAEYRSHVSQFYTGKDWRGNIDTWAANDDAMEALAKAGKAASSDANIRAALTRMGFKGVDQQALDMARDAIDALRNAATDYFEAKPQRAVGLSEFKGAVVPKGTSPEAIAILEKHGIAVELYGKTEGAREKAIQKLAKRLDKESGGVLFSRAQPAIRSAAAAMEEASRRADALYDAEPGAVTMEEFSAVGDARRAAEAAMLDALAQLPDSGFAVEARTSDGRMLIVTPSASEQGRWQLTRFGKDGEPSGDTRFDTKRQALQYLVDEAVPSSIQPAGAAMSRTVQPLRTPAATIRAAITKDYGKLLGQLESKGLVTLTQTEDEAIEAAARARAAKTGQSVERERARLQASIRGEADELSMSIYSDEAGKIERALEAMGLQVSTEGSRISQSTYVIVESPEYTQTEGESGSVLKIRVSDHRLPGGYQKPDFEVQVGNAHQGVDMADAAGAWFDAVRWVGRRFGVDPKGAAKRQIAAAAEKEANAKQAAVAAADQQRNRLDTSKARLQAWLQSLPDGALWGNARRGGWVAVLDGKMIGRFDGETATGEGQPWYGGPYPVEAQKNLQPVRESLRASVKNSVADPDIRRSEDGAIQGFFDPQTGQSFLIADNLTAEAAPGVLMHEVGIHMAADGSMKALFNRAAMMLKLQKGNPFMKAVQARMDAAGETSGEEAAAYIAEAYENDRANAPASVQRWLADLLAAVKAWMFKKGIMGADRLTVADIAAVARANARSMARDGGATGGHGFGPAFSHAPAGDQTQTENFRRWFAGSKVVDADGKPLVSRSSLVAARKSAMLEGRMNGGSSNAKSIADLLVSQAFSLKGLGGLEIPAQRKVLNGVLSLGDDFKVLRSVVDLVPVDVVNILTGKNLAPEVLFRDEAMLKQLLSADRDGSVSTAIDIADALVVAVAGVAAKGSAIASNPFVGTQKVGSAADTGDADVLHDAILNQTIGNNGNFDPSNPDIRFSRADMGSRATDAAKAVGDTLKSITVSNVKQRAGFKLTDYLGIGLQALGRRQIVDIYGDLLPLSEYNRLVQQMEADKNEGGAEADQLVTRWAKLSDETKLADLMHDATLAQIDPDKPYADGDDKAVYMMLQGRFKALSDEAKAVYRATRDAYRAHHAKVRSAIKDRIERSEIKGERKAALLKQMDDEFFKAIKGVYFPLARFGQYAVTVKGPDGKVESVSRAETKDEAEALRNNLLAAFQRDKGFTVGRVMLSKDFIADRDAVGRGFMTELYQVLDKQDMDAAQRAELEDTLGQLYLSSLPDLSWAKHGIHRKGTPGFSQDARRAFAQNMFHGARYLAKLRYSDLMQDQLAAMQKHVDDWREVEDFDQNSAQRVVDEMNKRHESLMNPKSNPLSTALTSLGFVFHLGLSPASAMVNLSQTALVAYPIMGAKWGFGKASAALLKASKQAAAGKNDITGSLNADERAAYDEAVRAGTIDVTMAHDLAGIAQGEDAGVMWKIRPVMRWASFLFHNAERFNRQVTFVAAYRLARDAGSNHKAAFDQATKATYDGHFDYGAANRPRIMQGNVAKVLLLFKQYGQNMIYTLSRNAYQSIKGTDAEKAEARKALAGLLASHAMAAGVLGLPMVSTLLAAASMVGGDDDEPWDAKVALQNMLADAFGQKPAEVLAHGLSRLTPWDISGRVGLDRLIFPDVQEGLEGQRLAESAMAAALGPVAGIGVNVLKGAQHMSEGRYAMGLEAMLPSALRGPVKALRYAEEGVQDKSGISILDQVSPAAVTGQALGFSPSAARNAQEGKSAILAHDRALGERRQELLTKIARATMAKDEEAKAEAREEIKRFNEKNPGRRINPNHIMASVHGRQKRINQAQDGVYLPRNRREAMEVGRFALAESE